MIGWITWFWMLAGPPIRLPFLPEAVRVYDLLWLVFVAGGILLVTARGRIPKPKGHALLLLFGVYLGLILFLPLTGLLFLRQAELSWYLGDLRWIQVVSIAALFFIVYRDLGWDVFHGHSTAFLLGLILVNVLVLLAQIRLQVGGGAAPFLLDLWYPDETTGYGRYGFHINRYAGAMTYASGLALVGGVLLLTGLFGNERNWRRYIIALGGMVFVLASGNRSLIFSFLLALPVAVLVWILVRGRVTRVRAMPLLLVGAGVSSVAWSVYYFDLGRMFSGDRRIAETLEWITGKTTFHEISGRGADRWLLPIQEAQSWSPFGTLVNPSHALSHLPAFDSYFVVMIAQAGPLLIAAFGALIGLLGWCAWSIWLKHRVAGALPLAIVITILLVSVTQNLMTGLSGRVWITLAVLSIVMYLTVGRKARGSVVINRGMSR